MSEVDGYGRLPFPRGGLLTAQLSPGTVLGWAGPAETASYLFPGGNFVANGGNPNQAIRWGTTSAESAQGGGVTTLCIPGRQYTASFYAQQGVANTLCAAVTDLTLADLFNRTTASGLGTALAGGSWGNVGGANSDYATVTAATGGTATHTLTSVNVSRKNTIGSSLLDSSQVVTIATSAVASGASITAGMLGRYVDASNYVRAVLSFSTTQTISVLLVKRVGASETTLATTLTTLTHAANTQYSLRFDVSGNTVRARAWLATALEPSTWDATFSTDPNPVLTTPGSVGLFSRLTTGNTNTLPVTVSFTNYGATGVSQIGTSINRPLEWSRLSVTFTATQPSHTIAAVTTSTAANTIPGVGFVDNLQMEPAGSASAFQTTGPVIYPVMRNFAERWPRVWSAAGFEGFTQVPCVDGLAALNAISYKSEYREAVLVKKPAYYWILDDAAEAVKFREQSGNQGPPLVFNASKYGAGVDPAPGTAMGVVGDPGGTGVTFTPGGTTTSTSPGTTIATGPIVGSTAPQVPLPAAIGSSWAMSVAVWVKVALNSTADEYLFSPVNAIANTLYYSPLDLFLSVGSFVIGTHNTVSGVQYQQFLDSTVNVADSLPHLVIGTVTQDATNTVLTTYVDGVSSTVTYATSTLGGMLGAQSTSVNVGGFEIPSFIGSIANGALNHVAVWNRALTSTEAADLWNAGGLGYAGETSGSRILRHLTRGGYTGAYRISTGQSTMEPPTFQGSIDLLTDSQNTTTAEQGTMWIAPDGAFVFEDRNDRFLRLTSTYTLGENTAGGQSPYLGDIEFDYDPQFVYADVTVTRNGGATAVGGSLTAITTAGRKYFPRSYQASVDLADDTQIQYMADWVFSSHRTPLLRVNQVTLHPASNTALWPIALSIEVGMRVTVVRVPKAGNAGAGFTMTGDYFVESVTHDNINFETGEWETTLLLSPIGSATSGTGVTVQPWILGNATYGVLGSTTVLGW